MLQNSKGALQLSLYSYLTILLLFYLLSISFFLNFGLKLKLNYRKLHERGLGSATGSSVLSQKFAKEVGRLLTVMPAKAGIQKHLIILDSGSR